MYRIISRTTTSTQRYQHPLLHGGRRPKRACGGSAAECFSRITRQLGCLAVAASSRGAERPHTTCRGVFAALSHNSITRAAANTCSRLGRTLGWYLGISVYRYDIDIYTLYIPYIYPIYRDIQKKLM